MVETDMTGRVVTEVEVWEWLTEWFRGQAISKPVTRATDIGQDLGIQGDDAWELFDAFFRRFDLAPGSFDYGKHFDHEGDFVVMSILRLLRPKRFYPVTVGDMVDAALRGRFDYDYESRQPY